MFRWFRVDLEDLCPTTYTSPDSQFKYTSTYVYIYAQFFFLQFQHVWSILLDYKNSILTSSSYLFTLPYLSFSFFSFFFPFNESLSMHRIRAVVYIYISTHTHSTKIYYKTTTGLTRLEISNIRCRPFWNLILGPPSTWYWLLQCKLIVARILILKMGFMLNGETFPGRIGDVSLLS